MQAGRLNKRVSLSKRVQTSSAPEPPYVALSPDEVFASIEPSPPGGSDDRTITHIVTIRYHAQVTLDTVVRFGSRDLFVRGLQNVAEANRELRLFCEEAQP